MISMSDSTEHAPVVRYYLSLLGFQRDTAQEIACLFFLSISYINIVSFIYVYAFHESTLSYAAAAAVTASYTLSIRFSRIPILWLLIRVPQRVLYCAASLLSTAGNVALALWPSFWFLMIFLFLIGACYGLISTLVLVAAAREGGNTPFVGVSVRSNVAALLGAPIGILLYRAFGIEYAFLFGAAMSLCAFNASTRIKILKSAAQVAPSYSSIARVMLGHSDTMWAFLLLMVAWATCHQVYVLIPYNMAASDLPAIYQSSFFYLKCVVAMIAPALLYLTVGSDRPRVSTLLKFGAMIFIASILLSLPNGVITLFTTAILFATGEIIVIPLLALILSRCVSDTDRSIIFVLHPAALGVAELLSGTLGSLLISVPQFGVYAVASIFIALNLAAIAIVDRISVTSQPIDSL